MSFFHLLTPSFVAGATVTSNSDDTADTRASNLVLVDHARKWRSNGASSTLRVTIDAGEARPWDTVYLGYNNGAAGDTIRLRGHDSTGVLFSAPSYSSGIYSVVFTGDLTPFTTNHTWINTGSTHTFRYLGIEINNLSNPNPNFEAGVVVAGNVFTPDIGPEIGVTFGRDDPSIRRELLNGSYFVRPRRGHDVMSLKFPHQSQDDTVKWLNIYRNYGQKIPMVAKFEPWYQSGLEQYTIIYGFAEWRSGGAVELSHPDAFFDVDLELVEL